MLAHSQIQAVRKSLISASGTTVLGPPDSIVDLGTTCLPREIFLDWMNGMSLTTFKGSRYHLLDHNCNNFSNEMAQFLTGKSIPLLHHRFARRSSPRRWDRSCG
ncbi:putative Desumoylating isopeptidase 1 [Hypsibius exemplaris]|uniref:Desumoylating isopeptidase 1 n=1 Tax=Hypsibius exemplaris TaxID=2072580 RepID=A0A9X6NPI4_HYPEX|nr:putative Desumoylating isopeptidase 1 [Hypsibius exemplaris]